jgi:LEA14-like dessication related protein
MFIRHGLVSAFLVIVMLSGCASFGQAPRVTLKENSMVGLDMSGITIEFHLGITNPNSFDLSLLGYTFDLRVLNLPLSTGGMQESILFPAGKEAGMRLPVRLKFTDLLEIINHAPDPDTIPYQLNIMLQLKTPLGEMAVPAEKSAVLTIPEQYRPAAYINRVRDALQGIR